MRKFLLALCVAVVLLPAFSADWVNSDGDFFVDTASVKRERNLVHFNLMQFNAYTGAEDLKSISAVCLGSLLNGIDVELPETLSMQVDGEEFSAPKDHPFYKACSTACNIVPENFTH